MFTVAKLATTVAAAALYCASAVKAQNTVFAHIVMGNTLVYSYEDCMNDVKAAAAAGIDGFALNLASVAAEVDAANTAIGNYYKAAEEYGNGFSVFISFDYDASDDHHFSADSVKSYINQYINSPAQYKVQGRPFASSFEGPAYVGEWTDIKAATNAYFVPDYSSKDVNEAAGYSQVDGLLSWDAWPEGPVDLPDDAEGYTNALAGQGKTFMMPVSPWFYTNLPSKNWLWRGDGLWHERWMQVMQYKPQFVEIVTWNDWGESHYIAENPSNQAAYPQGAADYNLPVVHNAWQNDLPYYIAMYKNGGNTPAEGSYTPHVTFWYKLSPASACPNTPCNAPYQSEHPAGSECSLDEIYFTVFTGKSATVNISIGGAAQPAQTASGAGLYHGSVPFNGQLGDVSISVSLDDGSTMGPVAGPAIRSSCDAGWNAWVGGS